MNEYKSIMSHLPLDYRIKDEIIAVTPMQILSILRLFLEKDSDRSGVVKFEIIYEMIMEELGFKVSKQELELILRQIYEYDGEISSLNIKFPGMIEAVDVLKREKVIIREIANKFNKFVIVLLFAFLGAFVTFFYN